MKPAMVLWMLYLNGYIFVSAMVATRITKPGIGGFFRVMPTAILFGMAWPYYAVRLIANEIAREYHSTTGEPRP